MGYCAGTDLDPEQEHEGWVAMTYADGRLSSGTSNGVGHYLDGYKYLPADDSGCSIGIDPAYLRPFGEVSGWVPRCECGWVGVSHPLPDDESRPFNEPSDTEESLLMGQWRAHLRDAALGLRVAR